jgi:hypothetical protein
MRLIQISAWNDSGGGFLHRLLDGHPQLRSWPFELLLGRDGQSVDAFGEDWFKGRFRWPRLGSAVETADAGTLFDLLSDVELKDTLRSPATAKHGDFVLPVDLGQWREEVARRWPAGGPRLQKDFLRAYLDAFFFLLEGRDDPRPTLAHCPVSIVDAPETWADFPQTRFICVVRSPLSGYQDMARRHPGLEPGAYARKWSLVNGATALWAGKAPDRVKVVTLRQLLTERERCLGDLCAWLGIAFDRCVLAPTWRGRLLDETVMGPFGGVPSISLERESDLAAALDPAKTQVLIEGTAAVVALLGALGVELQF